MCIDGRGDNCGLREGMDRCVLREGRDIYLLS